MSDLSEKRRRRWRNKQMTHTCVWDWKSEVINYYSIVIRWAFLPVSSHRAVYHHVSDRWLEGTSSSHCQPVERRVVSKEYTRISLVRSWESIAESEIDCLNSTSMGYWCDLLCILPEHWWSFLELLRLNSTRSHLEHLGKEEKWPSSSLRQVWHDSKGNFLRWEYSRLHDSSHAY